ncbi:MAG: hypothetical protein U0263_01865 [Polyangiaceae bacterium]
MSSLRQWVLGASLLAALSTLGTACSSDDTNLGGNRSDCAGQNWRAATPDGVVCPGADGCLCSAGQVCCVEVVNNRATNGSCTELTACSGPALRCDGPEDCQTGQVCCVIDTVGGGSECRAPNDCFFSNEAKMCRDDANCDGLEHCTPGETGSFLGTTAAFCKI